MLGPKPMRFGEQTTGDTLVSRKRGASEDEPEKSGEAGEGEEPFPGAKNGVVMYDRGTDFLMVYPTATRTEKETTEAFRHWEGPKSMKPNVESFYADNATELKASARKLEWHMPTSTPGEPKTNGLAERFVRRVKAGARANLSQSGLGKEWWPFATTHFCFARNVNVVNGDSAYNQRHQKGHCRAKRVPFGTLLEFLPTKEGHVKPGVGEQITVPAINITYLGCSPGTIISGNGVT